MVHSEDSIEKMNPSQASRDHGKPLAFSEGWLCLRRLGVSPRPPRNRTGGGQLWLLGYTRQGLGAKAQIWGNRKVGVRHHLQGK